MKSRSGKALLCLILFFVLGIGLVSLPPLEAASEEAPLMRIVMMADLHVEYGLQALNAPIRPSTVKAVNKVRTLTGGSGVDVVLVGGDMSGPRGEWVQELIPNTQASIYRYMSNMTSDGKVMLVTGNHDPEPSVKVDSEADDPYSGDYSSLMLDGCGEFVSALYVNDISTDLSPYNELLCYRYTVKGIEFIGLNTPYITNQAKVYGFYAEQTQWIADELEKIGKDKTVFLTCHYPLDSVRTISDPSTPANNTCLSDLKELLAAYPNTVFCYGHVHSGDRWWAKTDTLELVQPTGGVTRLDENVFTGGSYISAHMASMGYYNNAYQPGGLTINDPKVVQFVMVELYADRMVFRVYNAGEKVPPNGTEEVKALTVVRDLSAQFGLDPSEGVYDPDEHSSEGLQSFPMWIPLVVLAVGGLGIGVFAFVYKKRQAM